MERTNVQPVEIMDENLTSKMNSRENSAENNNENTIGNTKEISSETNKEIGNEINKEIGQEISKEITKETGKEMSKEIGSDDIKGNTLLLIWALALGLLFNVLFYDKPLGLSYPLYVTALYFVLVWNIRKYQKVRFGLTWLLGISIMALSFSYLLFSNEIFAALNFLVILVLLVAHSLLLTSNNRHKWFESSFFVDLLYGIFARPFMNFLKPFSLIARVVKQRTNLGKFGTAGKVLAGLLITIPLLIVIIPLLASADDVFRYFIELIPNVFESINLDDFISRVLVVTVVTCILFSYLLSLFYAKREPGANTDIEKPNPRAFLDPVTVTTVLVLIDVLYIFFIVIQFSYLFGSVTTGLPSDLTYAEYARKGFFELVAVTLINLGILLGSLNLVKASENKLALVVKALSTILVVSTFIMLLSAHLRMSLYEEAYGFTYLRILTHAFMVYLFGLFVISLAKIWRPTIPLLKSYIVVSIVAYTLINYVNVDKVIAENNIERYNNGNSIDIAYLSSLSYDAVPLLVDFRNNTTDQELANQLENMLEDKKAKLEKDTPWQSFNISKYRAKKALIGQEP